MKPCHHRTIGTRLTLLALTLAITSTSLAQPQSTIQKQPAAPAATAVSPYSKPGPHKVQSLLLDWVDPARDNRAVPVKVYFPAPEHASAAPASLPIIIFSHGLGGSREGYTYLGEHWASQGYVVIHPQHLGSDTEVWKGQKEPLKAMRESIRDPQNALNRPKDVTFIIDQLALLNTSEGPLKGRLDTTRIGIGGHSFGAFTTLSSAGQTLMGPLGRSMNLGDKRIKSAIAMSPQPPSKPLPDDRLHEPYDTITIPLLHMTGTQDKSVVSDTTPEQRRIPFDNTNNAPAYLLTLTGGDHMVFSGRRRGGIDALLGQGRRDDAGKRDDHFRTLILDSSTAFWDATLKNSAKATEHLLDQGPFERALASDGKWETRNLAKP
jgi:dienelactone hydrolase